MAVDKPSGTFVVENDSCPADLGQHPLERDCLRLWMLPPVSRVIREFLGSPPLKPQILFHVSYLRPTTALGSRPPAPALCGTGRRISEKICPGGPVGAFGRFR